MTGTIENLIPTDMIFKTGRHLDFLWFSQMKYDLFVDKITPHKYGNKHVKIVEAHLRDYGSKFPIEGVLRPHSITKSGKVKTNMHFIIPKLNLQGITTHYDENGVLVSEIYNDKRMLEHVTPTFQVQKPKKDAEINYIGFILIPKF